VTNIERLRRLALAVQEGASTGLYDLEWKSIQESDDFGVCPRVYLGGNFSAVLRLGCYSEHQAQTMQQLADYLAALTPGAILELLDHAD
jgi:hypothetical protein